MTDERKQIDELLKKVLPMETQAAFDFLAQANVSDAVLKQVVTLIDPSDIRTTFLQNKGFDDLLLPSDPIKDLTGQTIQGIEFIEALGQGGMGAVYLAKDLKLQRPVAVKVLHRSHQRNPQVQERFRREALILSQLDHPNICRIYNLLEHEDTDLLVLELIQGTTLRLTETDEWSHNKKINTAMALLEALKVTHSKNIIHRDLKPDNIMVTQQGQIKILDFGISRLDADDTDPHVQQTPDSSHHATSHGAIMGTLAYMSPEQASGGEVTSASDIYSLGLIFQELFSKTPVYSQSLTNEQLMKASTHADTQKPIDISHDLTNLIQRMKAASPSDRPTAVDAIAMLEKIKAKPLRRLQTAIAVLTLMFISGGVYKYIKDLDFEKNQAQLAQIQAEQAQQQAEQVSAFLISVFEVSNPYTQQAENLTAMDLLNQGAEKINNEIESETTIHHVLKATIGDVYHVLGKMEKAESLIKPAYQAIIRHPEATPSDKANIASKFATLSMDQGHFEQALKSFEESNSFQPSDMKRVNHNKNYMALIHVRLNQFDQALATTQEIINSYQNQPEMDSTALANAHNARGMSHQLMGDLSQAEKDFKECLRLIEQTEPNKETFGTLINAMGNLAGVYSLTDRSEASLELRKQVVKLSEDQLPENHPDLIGAYDNLAVDYYYLEDLEQAKFWNQKALKVFENVAQVSQNNHENFNYSYAMTLANYGILLIRSDDFSEAKAVFIQVVELMTKALGSEHDTVAAYRYELANAHWQLGEVNEALSQVDMALAIFPNDDIPFHRRELKTLLLKAQIAHHHDKAETVNQIKQQVMDTLQSQEPINESWIKMAEETFNALGDQPQ